MIDRAATIEKFGYDPDILSRGSGKRVVAVCEGCGKVRDLRKNGYRDLCMSCSTKKHYEDIEAREITGVAIKKHYEDHPEARKKASVAKKKHYENHPETQEKMCIAAKKRWEKPDEHAKNSVALKKHYEDPKAREKISEAQKKRFKDPEAREKNSAAKMKYYEDPKARAKHSLAMKKCHGTLEAREKQSATKKKYFEDPEARKKHSAAIQGIPYDEWEAFAKEQKYCPAFNEACRESNREKYGRRCFICDLPEAENKTKTGKVRKLSVHHVDMNKDQGCDGHEWKLVPVCLRHHKQAHTVLWIGRITYLLHLGV